jgi:hypothetical protein
MDSLHGIQISAALRRFMFCSFRLSNEVKELETCGGKSVGLGRLSAIRLSAAYRDQLSILMADLGSVAGRLEQLGMASQCVALDDLLDQCNTLESLWNILEIFAINSASHCYFEMVRWLQVDMHTHAHTYTHTPCTHCTHCTALPCCTASLQTATHNHAMLCYTILCDAMHAVCY